MTEYIKNFVTGHGIKFEASRRNVDALLRAPEKWAQIAKDLAIKRNSVILFCGAKNNGKSSLVRYLVNNHQDDFDDDYSYYIDFDPGQPEMTVPGTVSAHIIRASATPLQSQTYLNTAQHEVVAMSCVGGTNMSVNPRMYIENCRYIVNQVLEHQSKQKVNRPVFINTMGFIRNVGLAMLLDLIKISYPTDLVVLNVEGDAMRTVYADLSPAAVQNSPASFFYETSHNQPKTLDYRCHVHNLQFSFVDSSSIANKNRAALQLAYLSSIPDALYKPVMQLSTKWLPLSSVYIYCVSSYPLKAGIVLELLNHSWIHLVKLRKAVSSQRATVQGEEGEEEVCKIIENVGENSMLGCGIVAEIDFAMRRLAIITPLSQETMNQEVDCLIKPLSIQVSREILQASS